LYGAKRVRLANSHLVLPSARRASAGPTQRNFERSAAHGGGFNGATDGFARPRDEAVVERRCSAGKAKGKAHNIKARKARGAGCKGRDESRGGHDTRSRQAGRPRAARLQHDRRRTDEAREAKGADVARSRTGLTRAVANGQCPRKSRGDATRDDEEKVNGRRRQEQGGARPCGRFTPRNCGTS
jgi:hypothetical protein